MTTRLPSVGWSGTIHICELYLLQTRQCVLFESNNEESKKKNFTVPQLVLIRRGIASNSEIKFKYEEAVTNGSLFEFTISKHNIFLLKPSTHLMTGKPKRLTLWYRQYARNRLVLDCDSSDVSAFYVFGLRHIEDLVLAEEP